MNIPKIELKKINKWLWYLLAVAILFSATILSLVRFALTEVISYQQKIESLASQAIQHRVHIESLDARLVGLTPTLILKGVHILDKDGKKEILRLNEGSIGISLIQSLRHQQFIPKNIILSGTKLVLTRRKNGQIALHGFEFDSQNIKKEDNQDLTGWFFSQASLALKNSTLVWNDYKRNTKAITLANVDVELHNRGNKHQLTGSFSPVSSLGKRVDVALDIEGNLTNTEQWQGKFFVQGDEIYLTKWGEKISYKNTVLKEGVADFQVWGEWSGSRLNKVDGDISIYQGKVTAPEKRQLDIGLIGGLFEFNLEEQGWSLAVERFQYTGTGGILPETDFSIVVKNNDNDLQSDIDVRVDKFGLESIGTILINSGLLTKQYQELLLGLDPSGYVDTLRFARFYNQDSKAFDYLAHARLNKVTNRNFKKIPGIENLSGRLWLNQNKGSLVIDAAEGNIDFGKLFRSSIKLRKVKGNIDWWKFKHGWQVMATELQAENNEVRTLNNVSVYIPNAGPAYMDLHSAFAGSAQYKSNYLPVGIMSQKLVSWLDISIVSGVVSNGGVVYRGRFADFPFRDPTGQFLVQFYTDNLELDYQKGWPVIKDAGLDASFDSKGVAIDISLARLFSSAITKTSIKIADYRNPAVDISGQVTGGMGDVVRFVVDSPVAVSRELLDARYTGRATTDVNLHIPLKKGNAVGYSGTVHLNKGGIALLDGAVDITDVNGKLGFSNKGLSSDNLSARIFGERCNLNVYSQVVGKRNKTYLATSGTSDTALLIKQFSIPAYKHVTGQFNWQALLDFSDDKAGVPVLNVTSDLAGVEMNLPEPFRKSKNNAKDLSLKAYFKGGGKSDLFVGYGDNFSLGARFEARETDLSIEKGHIRFAPKMAVLPKNKILHVTGSLEKFSPGIWVKYMASYDELNIAKSSRLPVFLDMNKLDILIDSNKKAEEIDILPDNFPSLSGTVKQFVFDGMPLGKLDVDIKPDQAGININKLNVSSPDMNFTSSGRWDYKNNRHDSSLKTSLKSKNLGKLFKRLGLAAIINNGAADINSDVHWAGTPFDMSLSKLKGNINLYIKDGSIADIDPGAGRVVGLLSLSELPRRLMLDFSDIFKKGLVFDEIKGRFTLRSGNAYTKGVKVDGSVAEVTLQGRTGLVKRDYDLNIYVIPKVGDTLPLASGALFGTQIGALVYLFEKLVSKDIEKATVQEYKVTGSWENPAIKRINEPLEEKPAKNTSDDEE